MPHEHGSLLARDHAFVGAGTVLDALDALRPEGDVQSVLTKTLELVGALRGASGGAAWIADDDGRLACAATWARDDHVDDGSVLSRRREDAPRYIVRAQRTATELRVAQLDGSMPTAHGALGSRVVRATPIVVHDGVVAVLELDEPSSASRDAAPGLDEAVRCVLTYAGERLLRVQAEERHREGAIELDITRSMLAAEQRTRLDQQAVQLREQRLTDLGALAGGVAHDLRGPLAAMRNAAALLTKRAHPDADPTHELALGVIEKETLRGLAMLDDILDFARTSLPTLAPVSLHALVEEALRVVRPPHSGTFIRNEVEPTLDEVHVEAASFRRALVNLVQNALDATTEGTVTISAAFEGHELVLEVRDEGHGIPPEIQAAIFEPLFTTKKGGTGFGLSASSNIVRRHRGALTVDSALGKGTTMTIRIPRSSARCS